MRTPKNWSRPSRVSLGDPKFGTGCPHLARVSNLWLGGSREKMSNQGPLPLVSGQGQWLGRFFSIIGWDPSVCKSNRLDVHILRFKLGIFFKFLSNDWYYSCSLEIELVISQTQPVHLWLTAGSPHSLGKAWAPATGNFKVQRLICCRLAARDVTDWSTVSRPEILKLWLRRTSSK